MRKRAWTIMVLACVLTCVPGLYAGQIYHWTDKNGHDHITEDPPPPEGQLKETIEYTPQPAEERIRIEAQQDDRRRSADEAKIMQSLATAQKRAAEARVRAREARDVADELERQAAEFKATRANTNYRRKKNRSIVIRLENDAQEARKLALQAEEEARQAEKKASELEQKVAEIMAQSDMPDNPEARPTP